MDGPITDALDRAIAAQHTRTLPHSAAAQMRVVLRAHGGSTRAAAQALGVSQRTVQRYLSGASRRPSAALTAALAAEARRHWQPRVRARIRARAAAAGLYIETRARFGFASAVGSSDGPRIRRVTCHVGPDAARRLIDAHAAGAGEDVLAQIVADALGYAYFQDGGRRASGLGVELTDLDYLEAEIPT